MRSAIDKEKVKTKEYEIPTVIPIVLYTGKEKLEKLIKEMKGEDEDMLGCVEMVWEEGMNKGRKEGKKEGRRSIISNMLKNGMSLKEIQKITKATKKEIEEAKGEKE